MSKRAKSATREAPEGESTPLGQLWEQVRTIVLAIGIALVIRLFIIEPFRIPSGSMLPTLLIGDHLFVNKFIYGVQIPFTEIRLPAVREPHRGDVVVFNVARQGAAIYPVDRRPDLPRDRFVKRIVGLPGETIEVRNGTVLVNGEPLQKLETGEFFEDRSGRKLKVQREPLDGAVHLILDDPRNPGLERTPFTIEAGRYFMMGDNRDDSNDSRAWGTVRAVDMKGPAFILYWSWDAGESWLSLLNPLNWWDLLVNRTRWARVGDPIR